MKSLHAFIAADGSLHRTTRSAAIADLTAMGLDAAAAELVVSRSEDVSRVLTELKHPHTIYGHYEPAPGSDVAEATTSAA